MRAIWQITGNFLRKLFLQRNLLQNLVRRDLRSRYVGSLMGLFWSVVHPLVLLLTYTFVFQVILKLPWKQAGTDSFPIFLFCGILPWLLFQDTVVRSATAVVDHSGLVRKTHFPVEIVPLSIFASNLVNHLIGLGILLLVLAWVQGLTAWLLLIPIYWVCLLMLSVGLGWTVAVLQVFLRDTVQVLAVVMTLWFWLTPIFYTAETIPDPYRGLILANPMAAVVGGYRDCLLQHRAPPVESVGLLFLVSLTVFAAGGTLFRVAKREFADVL